MQSMATHCILLQHMEFEVALQMIRVQASSCRHSALTEAHPGGFDLPRSLRLVVSHSDAKCLASTNF